MPAATPPPTEISAAQLQAHGAAIRARRKALGVSATAAAEAAGISRVTLHRIEKGEPSVTAGAWSNVIVALGLAWRLAPAQAADEAPPMDRKGWIPARIRLERFEKIRHIMDGGSDLGQQLFALCLGECRITHELRICIHGREVVTKVV